MHMRNAQRRVPGSSNPLEVQELTHVRANRAVR
jgi:hypothetical protein